MDDTPESYESRIAGRSISLLYRQAVAFLSRELEPYGVNSSEYIYLINIGLDEAVRQKRLSEKLAIDNGLTTRCLKSLEKKGFIVRQADAEDGRAMLVSLTEKGRSVRPVIYSLLAKWSRILSSGMTNEEIESFAAITAQMTKNVLNYTKTKQGGEI